MISKDKTYKTRGGLDVIIYAVYPDQVWGVHGAIQSTDGSIWTSYTWQIDGNVCNPKTPTDNDLVEVKPKVKYEKWFLFIEDGSYSIWNKKEDAIKHTWGYGNLSKNFALKKVSFEYEMGEGL